MNFRGTILAFGLLLGMLWLFGLMLALHTGTLEKDLLLPSLHIAKDAEIEQVTVANHDAEDAESVVFTKTKDKWRVRVPPVKRSAAVDGNQIESIIRDLRDARQNREVSVRNDLAYYGLAKPSLTITLRGKEKTDGPEREWQVFVGKKSPDKDGFVYVNSSERPGEVLAVPESNLRKVFFKNVQDFRVHDLLETTETSLQWLRLADDKHVVELKKQDADWQFVEPRLGYAEWQSPEAKKLGPVSVAPDGVRAVVSALAAIRVDKNDDFVPLTDDDLSRYGLAPGSENLRIAISNDLKDKNKQILFVGKKAASSKEDRYYARLDNEDSIVMVDGLKLAPLFAALKDPESLRSKQLVHVEAKNIVKLEIRAGKEVIDLQQPNENNWKVALGSETLQASEAGMKELLEILNGERQIKEFIDITGEEAKKKDAELGLDQPVTEIKLWSKSPATEEKKSSPKETKSKKDEAKKDGPPVLAITIDFGTTKGDLIYGKSVTIDGVVTRFAVSKTLLDKLVPKSGALALLDVGLPVFTADKVTAISRVANGARTDIVKDKNRWQLVNAKESSSGKFADSKRVDEFLTTVNHLKATDWVQKVDAKTDLAEFGLKAPLLEVRVRVADKELKPADYAGLAGLALESLTRPMVSAASVAAQLTAAGMDEISYKFGKKTDKDGKEEIFGMRGGSNLLFRIAGAEVHSLTALELRDRFWLSHFEPVLDASLTGLYLANGPSLLLASSPLATHQVARFDPAQVKEIRVAVRTAAELRRFGFVRKDDKIWDKSGLEEFDVDSPQINQFVDKLSSLSAQSFVSLQGGALPEQKLSAKEASVAIELLRGDAKIELALTVGARAEGAGFYAQSSAWPGAVFTLPAAEIDALLRGPAYFGKTKVASVHQ